jgi:hypothetical protein
VLICPIIFTPYNNERRIMGEIGRRSRGLLQVVSKYCV